MIKLIRKTIFTILGLITINKFFIYLIAIINRITGRKIKMMFYCYPVEARYYTFFYFHWFYLYTRNNQKFPLLGINHQKGTFGLTFGLPYDESLFFDEDRKDYLKFILDKINQNKKIIGAQFVNYTGILPSVINKNKWESFVSSSGETVGSVVFQAVEYVVKKENINDLKIIVLGGDGYIGKNVCSILKDKGYNYYVLDKKINQEKIPNEYKGSETILIDVSNYKTIYKYIDQMWEDLIILNEVFPEPVNLERFNVKSIYHIQGIRAKVIPSLPFAYRNSLPCCAIVPSQEVPELKIKKIY